MQKKGKKKKRPVVMSPIPNRIVQRALLDVIQGIPSIKEKLLRGHNFGGIEELGVPKAVEAAYVASRQAGYFVRTDIQAFFDKIPRQLAIDKIAGETNDSQFNELLIKATTTELDNLVELARDGELFPLENIGVAQGSSLSPLLCNLLLEDLDTQMNDRGIVCVRYIDDFILFSRNRDKALRALASARRHLRALNLDCYDPQDQPDKAEQGPTSGAFHFLGCEITPSAIRPSRASRVRLMSRLGDIVADALSASHDPLAAIRRRKTYVDSLHTMSNVIRGWGNTYSFCTDDRLMDDIDRVIDAKLAEFRDRYAKAVAKRLPRDRRRLTGVFPLSDCKRDESIRDLVSSLDPRRNESTSA